MACSYVRQNVMNRFELQPRSGERSYDSRYPSRRDCDFFGKRGRVALRLAVIA